MKPATSLLSAPKVPPPVKPLRVAATVEGLTMDDQHRYTLDGRPCPGVTQVIEANVPGWKAAQWYLDRGTAVHLAVLLALRGKVDWSTVDPRIKGRVEAILSFLDAEQLRMLAIEHRLASSRFRYAGTLDFVGWRVPGDHPLTLCDWKSTMTPQAEVQLGAYAWLWDEIQPEKISRGAIVECRNDGSYKCKWLSKTELRQAGQTFMAMLSVFNFRAKHKLNKQKENYDGPTD